jgi:hypothetical protein
MEKVRLYILYLYVVIACILTFLCMPALAQSNGGKITKGKVAEAKPVDLLTWPEVSQTAARETRGMYGKPDVESEEMIIWHNKRQWKMITVTKSEYEHNFPLDHTDVIRHTVSYRVPIEFYDDLAQFNGSITIDRTLGTISAMCDHEANNILTLNLAHDIILGKKTVEEARKAYANILIEKMLGGNPEYMQKLNFVPDPKSNEPDINTTGLTRRGLINIARLSRSN